MWLCASNVSDGGTDDRRYPKRPMAGVGVVVLRGDDVLLIRRGKQPRLGEWSMPGGLQELGETSREAARREVLEETGIDARIGPVIDVIDILRHDTTAAVETHYTLIDFVADWVAGEPIAGDDAMHAEFVPLAGIDDLGMWAETVRVIRQAAATRR